MTYSPEGDTNGELPTPIMDWLKEHAFRMHCVEEMADKKHIHCFFVSKKGYCRSWGNKIAIGEFKKPALKVNPHKDALGAVGYARGTILFTDYSNGEIKYAREYKDCHDIMAGVRKHVKTAWVISPYERDAYVAALKVVHKYSEAQALAALAKVAIGPGIPLDDFKRNVIARENITAETDDM